MDLFAWGNDTMIIPSIKSPNNRKTYQEWSSREQGWDSRICQIKKGVSTHHLLPPVSPRKMTWVKFPFRASALVKNNAILCDNLDNPNAIWYSCGNFAAVNSGKQTVIGDWATLPLWICLWQRKINQRCLQTVVFTWLNIYIQIQEAQSTADPLPPEISIVIVDRTPVSVHRWTQQSA